ncbi:Altered inheritance of mitochondria protein 1 [Turnera subulata]|uniref:Altered inheritance of mitochondria protein 1 n=1 Tax=Turnera subulata TaxID=218843 RepID=A0A9Q0JRH7_9ROSI|nr:Altered inheritance of mitochondria protein 1 [Turnera subulata]
MAKPHVTMEVGNDGVAVITICNPPVNALAIPILNGLAEKFGEATRRDDVKAIVLTGKGGRFSGGFDINVFQKIHETGDISILPDVSVDLVVNVIEDCKKPVVAAVEGLALGGGLELAMVRVFLSAAAISVFFLGGFAFCELLLIAVVVVQGCHARVAAPKTQLGLPELTLGVIPGFGGTQRLPRLLGLQKAIEIMLMSKPILSEEGNKLGLIDAVVPSQELLKVSRQWAVDIADRRKPWLRSLHRTDKIGSLAEAREVLKAARLQAKRTASNMPQHQACLDVIEEGIVHGGYNGVLKEAKVFKDLVLTDTSKGLVHSFFAQRLTSKVPNVTDVGLKPRNVKKVAVIGGGLMGSGIATALIVSNIFVVLKEINSEYLLKGIRIVEGNVRSLVTRKKLTKEKADKALSMLKGVLDYSEFKDVDMVIEAVIESVPLKQKIFSEIEKACPPHCILATNTSTIDLNLVGEKTSSKDRIIGAHFFSPAHIMPLLEIVRTEKTSAQAILDLMAVGKTIKKVPVVVGNCTGFAVNRAFFPYTQGAHMLVNLGVDVFRIDRLISSFGLPMGPFQLQDLAGYGVALAVGKEFANAFPDRTFRSPLVDLLIKSGRNGKNNGKGYYIYEKGSKPKPDPSVLPIIEEARRLTNIMPNGKPINVTDREIVEMVLFPVVNEACRVLDEGVVVRASDLDIASVLGMSFPSYRGGIVFWADLVGAKHVYDSLKKWSQAYGGFYKPSRFLEERATRGLPLSAPASSASGSRARM